MIGLQVAGGSGDPSRDIAAATLAAAELPAGTPVFTVGRPGPGPRLQDILDPAAQLDIEIHSGFDYWLDIAFTETAPLSSGARGMRTGIISRQVTLR